MPFDKNPSSRRISLLLQKQSGSRSLMEEHRFAEPTIQVRFLAGPPIKPLKKAAALFKQAKN